MKTVVSLALFGQDTRYARYLPSGVRAWLTLMHDVADFEIRIHHDDLAPQSGYWSYLNTLRYGGLVTLVQMGSAPKCAAMLWRMAPIWDEDVGLVFARDIDALPTPRERACMMAFRRSPQALHTIHDAPVHAGIMGGLCGFKAREFRALTGFASLQQFVQKAGYSQERWGEHGADQDALNRIVAPVLSKRGSVYEHRYGGWYEGRAGAQPSRGSGPYRGISEVVPDRGEVPPALDGFTDAAEVLVNHMGQADYDWKSAASFYHAAMARSGRLSLMDYTATMAASEATHKQFDHKAAL